MRDISVYELGVYRYRRCPLLLVQENIENKDILCIYSSIQGSYKLTVLFHFPQIWRIIKKDVSIKI